MYYPYLQGQWAWKNELKGRCACEFGYDFGEDQCEKSNVMTLEDGGKTIVIIIAVVVVVGLLLGCCMVFLIVRCICNAAN